MEGGIISILVKILVFIFFIAQAIAVSSGKNFTFKQY
jgi:hypothetical protein